MPSLQSVQWLGGTDGLGGLIDQTPLPAPLTPRACQTVEEIWEAIRSLRVRGAPAIGVTAAMGGVLGVRSCSVVERFDQRLREVTAYLRTSRPTAVNLFWALERMERVGRAFDA